MVSHLVLVELGWFNANMKRSTSDTVSMQAIFVGSAEQT